MDQVAFCERAIERATQAGSVRAELGRFGVGQRTDPDAVLGVEQEEMIVRRRDRSDVAEIRGDRNLID